MYKYMFALVFLVFKLPLFGQNIQVSSGHFYIDQELSMVLVNEDVATLNSQIIDQASHLELAETFTFIEPITALEIGRAYALQQGDADWQLYITELPIIRIDPTVEIVDEPRVLADFSLVEPSGEAFSSLIGIEFRGGSSQNYEKKSFRIEIWEDEEGEDTENEPLLGMRNDDDWNLQAAWIEPLRMRNMVSWSLWQDWSELYYQTEEEEAKDYINGEYVELFLGNRYWGLYQLTERMDRKQLKLKKYEDEDGVRGELFKAIGFGNTQFNSLPPLPGSGELWGGWQIKYPVDEGPAIDWSRIYDFVEFVRFSSEEDFLLSINEWIQCSSAIDYFLFLNVLQGFDNSGKNTFLAHYDAGEPFIYVPWDLDAVFGLDWMGNFETVTNEVLSNRLFDRLQLDCRVGGFGQTASARWADLRLSLLTTDNILNRFQTYYDYLEGNNVYTRESLKWPEYQLAIDHLQAVESWLAGRLTWLDDFFESLCISSTTSLTEPNDLTIFPNPAYNEVNIRFEEPPGQIDYQLYDSQGRIISKGNSLVIELLSLSLADWPNGSYQLDIKSDSHSWRKRLIKQ